MKNCSRRVAEASFNVDQAIGVLKPILGRSWSADRIAGWFRRVRDPVTDKPVPLGNAGQLVAVLYAGDLRVAQIESALKLCKAGGDLVPLHSALNGEADLWIAMLSRNPAGDAKVDLERHRCKARKVAHNGDLEKPHKRPVHVFS